MPGMAAPISGAGQVPGALDALSAGGGAPAAGQQPDLAAFMGQLRDLDGQIDDVMGQMPALAQIAQQMHALIKQAVVASAKMAPAQTPSGQALPGGAGL